MKRTCITWFAWVMAWKLAISLLFKTHGYIYAFICWARQSGLIWETRRTYNMLIGCLLALCLCPSAHGHPFCLVDAAAAAAKMRCRVSLIHLFPRSFFCLDFLCIRLLLVAQRSSHPLIIYTAAYCSRGRAYSAATQVGRASVGGLHFKV